MGLDGYWVDWEDSHYTSMSDKIAAIKAWKSYANTDKYEVTTGAKAGQTVDLSVENKDVRAEYHYGHRDQVVGLYNFANYQFDAYADLKFRGQNHGGDAFNGRIKSTFTNETLYEDGVSSVENNPLSRQGTRDRYFGTDAINYPEDNFLQGANRLLTAYYQANKREAYAANLDKKYRDRFQRSMWMWDLRADGDEITKDLLSSYSGDVRYSSISPDVYTSTDRPAYNAKGANAAPGGETVPMTSLNSLYRERTTIIGNKDWATTFDVGKGNTFSLFGSNDLMNNTVPGSTSGWKYMDMQSSLPSYRWYFDYYDEEGNLKDEGHSLTPLGRKEFPSAVSATLNHSTKKAFHGGTTLDYKGALYPGESFENKLYASLVPVKQDDKFSIVMKDNFKNRDETIIPELTLWEADKELHAENYKSDGTENDPADPRFKLGWGHDATELYYQRSKSIQYQKDVIQNYVDEGGKIGKVNIQHNKVERLDNGWLKVTYDLSSQNGKTITSFGIKATGKGYANNISNLSLGKMSYDAAASHEENIKIKNVRVDHTWKSEMWRKARIQWDEFDEQDKLIPGVSGKVREYLVFYKTDSGVREGLAWVGSQPAAYLDFIDVNKQSQNLEIVAVGNDYSVIGTQNVKLKFT